MTSRGNIHVSWSSGLIPLSYWLRRYTDSDIATIIFRILTIDMVSIYAATYFRGGVIHVYDIVIVYIVARLLYTQMYEIGYFVNDYWSEVREQGDSLSDIEAKLLVRFLMVSIFVRMAVLIIGIIGIWWYYSGMSALVLLAIVGLSQVVFAIHNIIFFPKRVCTYFTLHLARYMLVTVPLTPFWSTGDLALIICFVTPLAAAYSAKYYLDRTLDASKVLFRLGLSHKYGTFILRASALLYIPIIVVLYYMSLSFSFIVMGLGIIVAFDVIIILYRFASGVVSALADTDNIYHVHTHYSHDSSNELNRIRELLSAMCDHPINVYITDHAEDISARSYGELVKYCKAYSHQNEVVFKPGLEYPFYSQHILCFGLRKYIPYTLISTDIDKLNLRTQSLVWAHPHFSIKQLARPRYVARLLDILHSVDGVEFLNHKSSRGSHFWWRHVVVAFIACVLKPANLHVGVDAHDYDSINSYLCGRL